MHGTVGVLHGDCIDKLDLKPKVRSQAMAHVMEMVSQSLATRG